MEGLEAAGAVLHLAQLQHVVDAVFLVLDVAVEHGRVGPHARVVHHLRRLEPLAAVNLMVTDDVANAVREDLRAAARAGVNAGFLHLHQRFGNRELRALGKESDLDHGERLDVDLGEADLQALDQVEEVLERQVRMQTADDVELGHGFAVALAGRLPRLLERHGVGSAVALLLAKGAQAAARHADVGGIDVAIDVEEGQVAVQALANQVGKPADGQHVRRAVERNAVRLA